MAYSTETPLLRASTKNTASSSARSSAELELENLITTYPPDSSKPSSRRGALVIGACVATCTVIGGVLIPFLSPAFRKTVLPYVPATDIQTRNVCSVLKSRAGQRLVDLGSGDGRLVLAAAQEGLVATGVELNYGLVLYSRLDSLRKGFWKRTNFVRQDLFKTNLYNYDVIVLFGVPSMMVMVKQKLLVEMKADAMFVACRFPLTNVEPSAQLGNGIDTVWVYNRSDIQNSLTKS